MALDLLKQLLAENPENPAIHNRLRAVYLRQRDWIGLREELERDHTNLPPDLAEYERSYWSLLFGEMPKGWDQWEIRLRIPGKVGPPSTFTQPRTTVEQVIARAKEQAAAASPGAEAASGDDDVVDAEFSEVDDNKA